MRSLMVLPVYIQDLDRSLLLEPYPFCKCIEIVVGIKAVCTEALCFVFICGQPVFQCKAGVVYMQAGADQVIGRAQDKVAKHGINQGKVFQVCVSFRKQVTCPCCRVWKRRHSRLIRWVWQ